MQTIGGISRPEELHILAETSVYSSVLIIRYQCERMNYACLTLGVSFA
jgi:hypothetical protein